jgi:hypothetical protein
MASPIIRTKLTVTGAPVDPVDVLRLGDVGGVGTIHIITSDGVTEDYNILYDQEFAYPQVVAYAVDGPDAGQQVLVGVTLVDDDAGRIVRVHFDAVPDDQAQIAVVMTGSDGPGGNAVGGGGGGGGGGIPYTDTETEIPLPYLSESSYFAKTIAFGALPNGAVKSVAHGITGLTRLIDIQMCAVNTAGTDFIPIPFAGALSDGNYNVSARLSATNLTVETTNDMSDYTANATLVYLK